MSDTLPVNALTFQDIGPPGQAYLPIVMPLSGTRIAYLLLPKNVTVSEMQKLVECVEEVKLRYQYAAENKEETNV